MLLNEKYRVETPAAPDENRVWNFFHDRVEHAGKVNSQAVELHREKPRFGYDIASGAGVFISPDPLAYDGRTNDLYGYAGGDPINALDPTGLEIFIIQIITVIRPQDSFTGVKSTQTIQLDTVTGTRRILKAGVGD